LGQEKGIEVGYDTRQAHCSGHQNVRDHKRQLPADRVGKDAGGNLEREHYDTLGGTDDDQLSGRSVSIDNQIEAGH
jgi:hypothetical protein